MRQNFPIPFSWPSAIQPPRSSGFAAGLAISLTSPTACYSATTFTSPHVSLGRCLQRCTERHRDNQGKAKFILATDGDEFHAEDLNSGEIVACDYPHFANHFGFFLPLAGISTVKQIRDNPIDIQATGRLNRLYVELLKHNEDWATAGRRNDMNQFMGRLIFCFFAEDTDIFNGDGLFTKTIEQMSDSRSDNTDYVLREMFRAMDTKIVDRATADLPRWADAMPYVNGGLFAAHVMCPNLPALRGHT